MQETEKMQETEGAQSPEETKKTEEIYEDDNLNNTGNMNFNGVEIEEFKESNTSIGVEATRSMTEDDIERLLSENADLAKEEKNETEAAMAGENAFGEDLLEVLGQEDNRDLQEIHRLLQKADNNEKIVEETESNLPEENLDIPEIAEAIMIKKKTQHAEARKRERDERRAKRVALREAKKADRMSAKAAKEAERKAKKAVLVEAKKTQEEVTEPQQLQQADIAGLDELLSMAENAMADDTSNHSESFTGFSLDGIENTGLSQQGDISQEVKHTTDSMVERIITEKGSRKKTMINRIMDLLTEEVEDEEETKQDNEDIQLSDENQSIIEELDKRKNKKNNKDKKVKKGKEGVDSTTENAEEGNSEAKAEKPSKKNKEKKEKHSEETISEEKERRGGRKIPAKTIMSIALFCVSLVAIIILVANIAGDYSAKKEGKEAYYKGDYQTCYQNLYGKKRNESEQVMYRKSESILRIRLWLREYEMFAEEGAEAEALDSLLQSVNDYPKLYEYAAQWTAANEVSEVYAQILGVLSEKYRLTEAQALEIATTENDADYSKKVYAIVDGEEYGSWVQSGKEEAELLQDVLAEEEELEEILFLDNSDT